MNLSFEEQRTIWRIRMEGEVTLSSASELKKLLMLGMASGKSLDLDLVKVAAIDLTALQLLAAATREAGRIGIRMAGRMSTEVAAALRDSGFEKLLAFLVREPLTD